VKITIDRDSCIECGSCETLCPDVFVVPSGEKSTVVEKFRVNGLPESGEIPVDLESCAQSAEESCPVSAIKTEK
jgi:ferredoxin